ncbi:hypothetical protein SALBM217S_00550 [Streptomyces griseoloalbus]
MAVLALLVPFLMLGVILMLGRYEEYVLPPREAEAEPGDRPVGVCAADTGARGPEVLRTGGTSVAAA